MEQLGKQFGKYVALNVMGMIGISCYILADTFFIARGLGADGLTALNLAIPVFSFMNGIGMMIGMGGATRFSIMGGRKESQHKNAIFTQAVYFTLACSVFFLIAGIGFAGPMSTLLGADEAVYELTRVYLRTFLMFSPMFMLNNVMICFVRNDGNPNLSMMGMILGSLSNIVLDYIFVFPLGMGMFGAAVATGISPVISICVMSLHFIKKRNNFRMIKKLRPMFRYMKDFCALGVSSLITEVSSGVVIIVFNIVILRLTGNLGVAAYGVVANLALVVIAIFNGIGQGTQPLLSRAYGAGERKSISRLYRYAVITALVLAAGVYLFMVFMADPVIQVFNKDGGEQLAEIAKIGIILYFTSFFFAGINIVSTVYFSSTDNPGKSFVLSVARGIVLVIPLALILSAIWGMTGVWLTVPCAELLTFLMCIYFKRSEKGIDRKKNT